MNELSFGLEPAKQETPVANLALSAAGLRVLELDAEVVEDFPLAFLMGMAERSRSLGDEGENAPRHWEWGGPKGDENDEDGEDVPAALLLVYDKKQGDADTRAKELGDAADGWVVQALGPTPNRLSTGRKKLFREHFGFVDGIGNPNIVGLGRPTRPENEIAAGEFLLGYRNESGDKPESPRVAPGGSRGVVLPGGDFGRNGSYLVFRQLEQHVVKFWNFLLEQNEGGIDGAVHCAAKMVGRWPNGAPLARWSESEPPGDSERIDDFLYAEDPKGLGCPLGAHIRRTNPRDAAPQLDAVRSLENTRKRRIMRRGRTYGATVPGWPDPEKLVQSDVEDEGRGIYFLCFCANLVDQFEFVQGAWANARHFGGLRDDGDPLLSHPGHPMGAGMTGFTIQREPVNRRIDDLPQFVTMKGGGYFFMPSRRALRYIAGEDSPS